MRLWSVPGETEPSILSVREWEEFSDSVRGEKKDGGTLHRGLVTTEQEIVRIPEGFERLILGGLALRQIVRVWTSEVGGSEEQGRKVQEGKQQQNHWVQGSEEPTREDAELQELDSNHREKV